MLMHEMLDFVNWWRAVGNEVNIEPIHTQRRFHIVCTSWFNIRGFAAMPTAHHQGGQLVYANEQRANHGGWKALQDIERVFRISNMIDPSMYVGKK